MAAGGALPDQWRRHPGPRPLAENGPIVEGVAHGTREGYNQKCKCRRCRAANRLRRNLTDDEMETYR